MHILFVAILCVFIFSSGTDGLKVRHKQDPSIRANASPVVPLGLFGSPDYVDLVKNAPRWAGIGGANLNLDPQGWPQQDFEWIIDYRRNKPWNGPDFNGVNDDISGSYPLTFQGQADVSGAGSETPDAVSITNITYSNETSTTSMNVVLHPGHWLFILSFTNTQRPGQSINTGLTNISMLNPGYSTGTTQLFTDRFLDVIKQLNPVSFRSFDTGINGYNIWSGTDLVNNTWATRSLPTDAYWPLPARNTGNISGLAMPWEIFTQICIQTNTPGWFSLPIGADDEYIQNFALLLKNGNSFTPPLDPNTPFYIEYSNEVWNFGFSQYIYNAVMAKKNNVTVLENYVDRAFQISNIFRQVFGDAAMGSIVRVVCLWQYGNFYPMQSALLYAQNKYNAPVNSFIWGIGEAPYVNPSEDGQVPYSANLDPNGVDRIMDTMYTEAGVRRQSFTAWQAVATFFGINEVGYESGPSLVAGIEGEVSRSDRMKDFEYRYFMENYFATGAQTVNFFALGPGGPGPFGDWYLFEHWGEYDYGKFQGFLAISGQPMPDPVVGYVLPWESNQNVNIDASEYATRYDFNTLPGSNAVVCAQGCWPHPPILNYLLRASATGTYQITIFGQTNQAGTTMDVWMDNQLIQTISLPVNSQGNTTVGAKITTSGFHTLAFSSSTAGSTSLLQGNGGIVITLLDGSGSATVPSAPLYVIGTPSDGNASLVWESVSTSTSYTIQRSTTSGGPYSTVSTVSTNSFVDTGLKNDVRYYYVVLASNSAGQSAFSPQIVVVPVQSVIPQTPQVTISSGVQDGSSVAQLGQVFLQWPAVPNTQYYSVTRDVSGGGGKTTLVSSFTGLSLYDTNLTPGTTYDYNVTATNSAGSSTASVSTTVPTTSKPGTPTNLTVTVQSGTAFLQWDSAIWTYPEFGELFVVERANTTSGPFTVLESLSTSNYADVTAGDSTFCYQVYGSSSNGGLSSEPSNVACTK